MQKPLKIPRKLKKGLKKSILQPIDANWKPSEVRIFSIVKPGHRLYKNDRGNIFQGRRVTSYTLG